MFRYFCILFLVTAACIGCRQNASTSGPGISADSTVDEALYPFPQYIESQVAYVDTVPLAIEMIEYKNGEKIDSGYISREKFNQLARDFIEPDPNRKAIRDQYEETSFQDLSLDAITFSITATNTELPLQRADILLNPDTKTVKYLILKKEEKNGPVAVSKNLMWVHNMNFQISISAVDQEGKETTSLIKVIWDKPLDQDY